MINKYKTLLNSYGINTPLRIAHFMAQIEHESGLKLVRENMNYSRLRLTQIFPKYFKDIATAQAYANKPEAIANRVYANRFGNGDEKSGDGWKYRAGGYLGVTFRDNYLLLSKDTRIDFLENPDLLLQEANAMISAVWFWQKNNLNSFADKDDIIGLTKRINGGLNGINHRKELLEKWKS